MYAATREFIEQLKEQYILYKANLFSKQNKKLYILRFQCTFLDIGIYFVKYAATSNKTIEINQIIIPPKFNQYASKFKYAILSFLSV